MTKKECRLLLDKDNKSQCGDCGAYHRLITEAQWREYRRLKKKAKGK